jgi:hypothetical protein
MQLVQQAPSPGVSQCLEYFVDVQVVFPLEPTGGWRVLDCNTLLPAV